MDPRVEQRLSLTRRHFLGRAGIGIGTAALAELLNQDLAREFQAVIAYVVYSQVLKGAAYMSIAKELEVHAGQELQHAITIAKQIDYLGGDPVTVPKPVKTSDKAEAMLQFDLDNEVETISNYRARVDQCAALGRSVEHNGSTGRVAAHDEVCSGYRRNRDQMRP